MSSNRLVAIFWIGASLCLAFFFERLVAEVVLGGLRLGDPVLFFDWHLSTILGFGLGAAVGLVTFLQAPLRALAFDVAGELKKVTWPTARDTQRQTLAVLAFAVVFALILGTFDAAGAKVMTGWLPWLIGKVAGLGR